MRIRPDVELANLTDLGVRREQNEDYFLYIEPESDEEFATKGRLLLVADGMGGHNGGEVASGIAAAALREAFLSANGEDPSTILLRGFSQAQQEIVARGREADNLDGMGTTCTAVILRNGELSYRHIGDSRLYLLRDGVLTQLTEDHTLVHQLVKGGALSKEEAETYEQKNVLTAALGMRSEAVPADFFSAISSAEIPWLNAKSSYHTGVQMAGGDMIAPRYSERVCPHDRSRPSTLSTSKRWPSRVR